MPLCSWLILIYCTLLRISESQVLDKVREPIFGSRNIYVTASTPVETGISPFTLLENTSGRKNNQWEITYLTHQDAQKLLLEAQRRQKEAQSASSHKPKKDSFRVNVKGSKGRSVLPRHPTTSLQPHDRVHGLTDDEGERVVMPLAMPLASHEAYQTLENKYHTDKFLDQREGDSSTPVSTAVLQPTSPPIITSSTLPADTSSTTAPTEKMEINSDDRMALLRERQREVPQLIFLADDPEAASRIPDLLTTFYGAPYGSPQSRMVTPGSLDGYQGAVTTRDGGLMSQDGFTIDSPAVVHLTPSAPRGNRERKRGGGFEPRQHVPVRKPSLPFKSRPLPVRAKKPGSGFATARVTNIEAECQKNLMRIHIKFNGSFDGLVYSAGYSHDLECVYINGSGRSLYEFFIKLNRCGTLSSNQLEDNRQPMQMNVMWNTLTVQYNPLIEEEQDEHFKVTCEYGLEIWKSVTFPFLDVEVRTGNPMLFTLSPPECNMEIRQGFDPEGPRVSSPVRVGDPLTLVIYMRSTYEGFDIVISDCFAHNGGTKTIFLIDSYGCPVDDKLISHFEGKSLKDGLFETKVFAFMKTFRFTGSPALYIECGVRMCHGDCPTQQCHWKRSRVPLKKKSRRSVKASRLDTETPTSNVSESVHLFQALQVLRDDGLPLIPNIPPASSVQEVCFSPNNFGIGTGFLAGLISLLMLVCVLLSIRLQQIRKGPTSSEIPPAPIQHTYKSEFVHSSKRRLA